jgi:hypothetical protein
MRPAAAIYLSSALVVLALGIYLLVTVGVGMGLLVLALLAGVLLVLAHGLFAGRLRVGRFAIALSSFVSLGLFLVPLYRYAQGGWPAVAGIWQVLGLFLVIAIAHALAVVFLFGFKPVRPNPSLNANVPHAGLRPGSAPPVSLFR